jgi:transcriptional antiterminator RfaH
MLHEQLLAREIECFFPRIQVIPVNPRSRKVRPYFPGYIFVKTNLDETGANTFKWMPYAQQLVAFDGIPSPVPAAIIEQLRSLLAQINSQGGVKVEKFSPGEQVKVTDGPFEGYQGIFDIHLSGTNRAKILIDLLGSRQLPVELDIDQIISKKKRP